jgi:hypothetical protein
MESADQLDTLSQSWMMLDLEITRHNSHGGSEKGKL